MIGGGCGGGSSQLPPGGGPGPGGNPFQARPFPGDFFMRLPTLEGTGRVPHAVYDPSLKELFVSNRDANAVEVYSTVDGHRVGEIAVPGPAGLSLSPGNTQLVIGTFTSYVYFADPAALHIVNRLQIPVAQMAVGQQAVTMMPVMPYAMADGSILLGMGGAPEAGSFSTLSVQHLFRYDPGTGAFAAADPPPGAVRAIPAMSLDGKHLLVVGAGGAGPTLSLYSIDAQGYVASANQSSITGFFLAANSNSTQFAIVPPNLSAESVTFLDANLQVQNQVTISNSNGVTGGAIYSRDGKFLYLLSPNGILTALNTQTGMQAGYLGVSIGGLTGLPQFFDIDETYHLLGAVQSGGVLIVNASQLQGSPPIALPFFTSPSTEASPNAGPTAGGTQVQFIPAPANSGGSADGIASSMEAYFGVTPATQDVVAPYPSSSNGGNFLTATTPAAANPGPVSVLLTDANNNPAFLPDAFSYGPHLLRLEPNAALGGDSVTIFAYGLGFFDSSDIHVTIGGIPAGGGALNSSASFDYPEQSVTVNVPAGTPGWADVTLTTSNGSDTLKRGFHYLKKEALLAGGPFAFAVYDSVRDHFYLTGNGNVVTVFDPGTQTFLQPLKAPAVSSAAVLQGEALTLDDSKLLVTDPADQLVVIFDLTVSTSTAVKVILPSDPPTALSGLMSIVVAAGNRAFVSLEPCITNPVREINLTDLSVHTRPDAASTCPTYAAYPEFGASSTDGRTVIFTDNAPLFEPAGPEYVWRYDASADSFTGPIFIFDSPWVGVGGKATVDGDGGVIAVSQGTLDQRLLPLVPLAPGGLDSRLNDSGSLHFSAFNSTNNSIFVSDTLNGRRLLMLGLPASINPGRPLAINPTGSKILVATQMGVSYFELGVIPLAVGTVAPTQAATGAIIQVRGSGFVASTAAQIGGKSASCTQVDSETLTCTVPNLPSGPVSMTLTNPDGQIYSIENAFAVH